jgi:hypothetical protein
MFGPPNVRREGLETIYHAAGMLRAQIIKGRLETSGIPVVLDYEAIGQVYGFTVDGLGEVRVMVPVERAEEARELITASDEDEMEESAGEEEV